MGNVIVRIGRLVAAPKAMLVTAALAGGLTVTACSPSSTPAGQPAGQAGPEAAAPAAQAGADSGCQAIASQVSTISSQLSATSGNYSAQVPVLQTWYNDLQAAQQEAQNGLVAGALGDTASGVENIIVDEQNLMDDPSTGFSQLDSDDSNYQSDVSDLETACGFSS
jgi:hypothetical protein